MPTLYRVFPYLPASAEGEPGGALYVPSQGGGRIDNPEAYSVLYLSDAPAGALAEAFGRFPEWPPGILGGSPSLPGSAPAIARYRLPESSAICNLDDAEQLLALHLRPSEVVTRQYTSSRAWAMRIYNQRRWTGVRWWSYYDSKWASFGLWRIGKLILDDIRWLKLDDPALREAGRTIARRIVETRRA